MSGKRINCDSLIGKKFNRLTVVDYYRDNYKDLYLQVICICDCDCGTRNKAFSYAHLQRGGSKSCGCYNVERLVKRALVIANNLDTRFVGVCKKGDKYVAQIQHVSSKALYLGSFDTKEEAQKARVLAELELLDKINKRLYKKIEVNQETVDFYLS